MAYTKTEWTANTPVTFQRLNNMENGIHEANIAIDKAGKANGLATLGEDGKIKAEQLPEKDKVKEYFFTKQDGCKTIFSSSKIKAKGGIVTVVLDMTFAKNIAKTNQIKMATFPTEVAPDIDIGINYVTNKGSACNVIVKAEGSIAVTAIDDLVEGDGIRSQTVYFV